MDYDRQKRTVHLRVVVVLSPAKLAELFINKLMRKRVVPASLRLRPMTGWRAAIEFRGAGKRRRMARRLELDLPSGPSSPGTASSPS